jgi:hypothetical protein
MLGRVKPRNAATLAALLGLLVSLILEAGYVSALRAAPARANWLVYRDAKSGLSFRYPPSLRVEKPDPAKLGLPDDSIVDLRDVVGRKGRHLIVLRFQCELGEQTPEMAAANAQAFLRQPQGEHSCIPGTSIKLDSHEAILECGCGWGGSCEWNIEILQPRACSVSPGGPPARFNDNLPPPHDGHFPLLSILKTVHFRSVSNK